MKYKFKDPAKEAAVKALCEAYGYDFNHFMANSVPTALTAGCVNVSLFKDFELGYFCVNLPTSDLEKTFEMEPDTWYDIDNLDNDEIPHNETFFLKGEFYDERVTILGTWDKYKEQFVDVFGAEFPIVFHINYIKLFKEEK